MHDGMRQSLPSHVLEDMDEELDKECRTELDLCRAAATEAARSFLKSWGLGAGMLQERAEAAGGKATCPEIK